MKYKRRKLVMGFVIMMACFAIRGNQKLQASGIKKEREISLTNVTVTANGGELVALDNGENGVKVRYSTRNEKEGFYTGFLYTEQKEILEDRDVVSFYISTKKQLNLNLNALIKDREEPFSILDNTQIMIKADKSKLYEIVTTEYGTFEIPAGFQGMVYLPIRTEDRLETKGFGLVTVLEQGQEAVYSIDSMKLLNHFKMEESLFEKKFFVNGETSFEIPVSGEYYYKQEVYSQSEPRKKLDCRFFLEEDREGVQMDEKGRIWVKEDALADLFTINVQIDGVLLYRYKGELVESWLTSMEYDAVKDFLVADPANVVSVSDVISIPYQVIRWEIGMLAGAFFLFYKFIIKRKG